MAGRRDALFPLVSTADGLARWIDEAALDPRVGGGFRFRLLDGVAVGRVLALDPVQHIGYTWDWDARPLGYPTSVAFDLIAHGSRTHLTLRHVGFRSTAQTERPRRALALLVRPAGAGTAEPVEAGTEAAITPDVHS